MLALWRKWGPRTESKVNALGAALYSDARLLVYRNMDAKSLGRLLIVSRHFWRRCSSSQLQCWLAARCAPS